MENYIVNTFVHISLDADILPHLLEFYKVNKTFKIYVYHSTSFSSEILKVSHYLECGLYPFYPCFHDFITCRHYYINKQHMVLRLNKIFGVHDMRYGQSLDWDDPVRRTWQPTPVFLPGKYHVLGCRVRHD